MLRTATPLQASIPLMRDFTLPRPRSPGFGSYGCDSGPIKTPPLARNGLRACRFPYASGVEPLRLATPVHSPARYSKRTARLWRCLSYYLLAEGSFEAVAFGAVPYYPHLVSGSFHPPQGVLFSFPSRY